MIKFIKTQANDEGKMKTWLQNIFGEQFTCNILQGDASDRIYYRIKHQEQTYILMKAKVNSSWYDFLNIADHFSKANLAIPKRLHINNKLGLMILEDFGKIRYLDALTENNADNLYNKAIQAIISIQKIVGAFTSDLPKMDTNFLNTNFEIFKHWFLVKLMNNSLSVKQWLDLETMLNRLIKNIIIEPSRLTHFDYHSRNIMVLDDGNPGILDFQDALMAPYTYDLVSLLQDCYISWPRNKVEEWACKFKQQSEKELGLPIISTKYFLASMDKVGLQRNLKNLGVFARLYLRDKNPNYLSHIPTLLINILTTCNRYPEYDELKRLFEEIIVIQFKKLISELPLTDMERLEAQATLR